MKWRPATPADVPHLAKMNAELIEDEGHWNPMNGDQLAARMNRWLRSGYTAVLFDADSATVAYALYCPHDDETSVYLRQFFVLRAHRRRGIGTRAFNLLRNEAVAPGTRIVLGVLSENASALAFWRSLGFVEYCRMMALPPAP